MLQGTTTQLLRLRLLGVSGFFLLHIHLHSVWYSGQHSKSLSQLPLRLMRQVHPMAATALIRFVRNFSKSLTSRMLSSTGCLGVISWDVKPNARETCMSAWTSIGCKLVIIMTIFLSTWCWDACLWCGSENDVYHTHFFRWGHLPDIVSEYMTTVSLIDTVVIACGYNPTLAIGTVPCQLSTVKSKIQINTVYTSTRLPPRQTIHPSIHMLKIQWAFHPDSPKNHLATDTWKMTFHSLPRFHSRLHVTSHWRQQNMIQNFHTSHHRHHHVLQPEGTDNQWCTSWWRASPLALPSWAASFRFLTKVFF